MFISWLIALSGIVFAQPGPITLDPSRATDTSFFSVFDEAEVIPLQTNRQSVFGFIKQLVVTGKYFIVLDTDTDAVLFFDKNGNYVTKYKNKLARYSISFIQWDRSSDALLVFSRNKNYDLPAQKLQHLLSSGSQEDITKLVRAARIRMGDAGNISTEELKSKAVFLTDPVCLGNGQFAYSFINANARNADTIDYQLRIADGTKMLKAFFPYNARTDSLFYGRMAFQCLVIPTLSDSVFFVTRPFHPSVYTLHPSGITESYRVVKPPGERPAFSRGIESASFFDGPTLIVSGSRELRGNSRAFNSVNDITNIVDFKQFLFFNMRQPFSDYSYYIFDKESRKIYNYEGLTADSAGFVLPVKGAVLAFDEKNIYQSRPARALLGMKKDNEKKEVSYPESLARFLRTGRKTDNPVIIRLKPKEKPGSE